ncbi:hypothetical protein ENTCAN_06462 [Enterobacter cancerogenus ATCC 35316]|nr:hypothetical protein ENTCAN_06462 [Enterobacter cancerogenus ATCC 35316]
MDLNISEIPAVLFPCLSAMWQANLMLKPRPLEINIKPGLLLKS